MKKKNNREKTFQNYYDGYRALSNSNNTNYGKFKIISHMMYTKLDKRNRIERVNGNFLRDTHTSVNGKWIKKINFKKVCGGGDRY